jgi:archaellum biogenesis protein FlaJ (TadC family)
MDATTAPPAESPRSCTHHRHRRHRSHRRRVSSNVVGIVFALMLSAAIVLFHLLRVASR